VTAENVESDEYASLLRSEPDVFIVMFETDDTYPDYWDACEGPSDEFRWSYSDLLETLRGLESQPRILIATPLPVYPTRAGPSRRDNIVGVREHLIEDVVPLIREIAAEANLPLVDIYGHMEMGEGSRSSASLSHDGVHFKRAGYERMCRAFVAALRELDL